MHTKKKLAILTVAIAAVSAPMLGASVNAKTVARDLITKPEIKKARAYALDIRRNTGAVYGRGYMNCINSGHPADFCQEVSADFR